MALTADANVIVLETRSAKQPGTRNWLFLSRGLKGLPPASPATQEASTGDLLAAFAAVQSSFVVRVAENAGGRFALTAMPASVIDAKPGEERRSFTSYWQGAVSVFTGDMVVEKVWMTAKSRSRQGELDVRIVPGLPSWLEIGYAALLASGFLGLPVAWRWYGRLWPAEDRSEYSSRIGFVAAEASFDGKVVKGAPYSAENVTEFTQVLPDGNRITRRNSAMVYRDSQGRTRREQGVMPMGIAELVVWRRPRVAILSTGDELLSPGKLPQPAKVFDSNRPMLASAVRELGAEPMDLGIVADVAVEDERGVELAREVGDAVLESLADVAEGEFGTLAIAGARNAVGDRAVGQHAGDEQALSCKKPHGRSLLVFSPGLGRLRFWHARSRNLARVRVCAYNAAFSGLCFRRNERWAESSSPFFLLDRFAGCRFGAAFGCSEGRAETSASRHPPQRRKPGFSRGCLAPDVAPEGRGNRADVAREPDRATDDGEGRQSQQCDAQAARHGAAAAAV